MAVRFWSWVEAGMVRASFCGLLVRTRAGLILISIAGLVAAYIVRRRGLGLGRCDMFVMRVVTLVFFSMLFSHSSTQHACMYTHDETKGKRERWERDDIYIL